MYRQVRRSASNTVWTAADLGVTDLVAVDAPEPLASFLGEREYLPRGVPLMKRIAALPGQTVCRIGRNVTVDTIAMERRLAARSARPRAAGLAGLFEAWREAKSSS